MVQNSPVCQTEICSILQSLHVGNQQKKKDLTSTNPLQVSRLQLPETSGLNVQTPNTTLYWNG